MKNAEKIITEVLAVDKDIKIYKTQAHAISFVTSSCLTKETYSNLSKIVEKYAVMFWIGAFPTINGSRPEMQFQFFE